MGDQPFERQGSWYKNRHVDRANESALTRKADVTRTQWQRRNQNPTISAVVHDWAVAECLGASVFVRLYAIHALFAYISFLEFRNSYYTRNRLLDHIDDDAFAHRNAF